MRTTMTVAGGAFVLVAAATWAVARPAAAQATGGNDCESDSIFPNHVYISGTSALLPLLPTLGLLLTSHSLPISVFYQSTESCLALNDLLSRQASTEMPVTDPPTPTQFPLFFGLSPTTTGAGFTAPTQGGPCSPSSTPPPIDIAVSDVFAETCGVVGALLSGQKEALGPIQAMTFAAPLLSTATAISAEAASVVFRYDAMNYVVPPWNQGGRIFVRPETSSVQGMVGAAIGLASSLWQNAQLPTAGAVACSPGQAPIDGCIPPQQEATGPLMQSALANVPRNPTATVGVLSAQEVSQYNAASNPNKLKILAYQHAQQACGYFPDSTVSAKDKLNVRQGRYAIWGPLHFFFHVDARGDPLPGNLDASNTGKIGAMMAILNYIVATGPNPGQTFVPIPLAGLPGAALDGGAGPGVIPPAVRDDDKTAIALAETNASLVPWCAMQVVRTSEIGPEASYQPREPCTCFYANAVGAIAPDYCIACTNSLDCAAPYPTCRLGYCETQ